MAQQIWRLGKQFGVGCLLGLLLASPALSASSRGVQYIARRATPSCTPSGQRTATLTQATVCGVGGTIDFYTGAQKRGMNLLDRFLPSNRLITKSRSAAELLFNDRTFVRFLPGADFTFKQGKSKVQLNNTNIEFINARGLNVDLASIDLASVEKMRSALQKSALKAKSLHPQDLNQAQAALTAEETVFDLAQGTLLVMNPPSSIATKVITPQSQVEMGAALSVPSDFVGRNIQLLASTAMSSSEPSRLPFSSLAQTAKLLTTASEPSAIIVRHDPGKNQTQVFSLTNSGIRVSNAQGQNTKVLRGGEFVSIVNGVVSPVKAFDLFRFYQTTTLANDLGPGQEDAVKLQPIDVQKTIWVVRVATQTTLKEQQAKFFGNPDNPVPLPLPPSGQPDRGNVDGSPRGALGPGVNNAPSPTPSTTTPGLNTQPGLAPINIP